MKNALFVLAATVITFINLFLSAKLSGNNVNLFIIYFTITATFIPSMVILLADKLTQDLKKKYTKE